MQTDNIRISVVIPAYNEERFIRETLESVPDFVDSIIVVDDCSTDKTKEKVRFCRDTDSRISLISHKKNGGVGRAIVSGYSAAMKDGAHIVAVMNGDKQMDPESLPRLIRPIVEGKADYVRGNRFGNLEVLWNMPPLRLLANLMLSTAISLIAFRPFSDVSSGYTAISRKALETLDLDKIYPQYGVPVDLLLRIHKRGWKETTVPTRTIYPKGNRSGIQALPYMRAMRDIIRDHHEL